MNTTAKAGGSAMGDASGSVTESAPASAVAIVQAGSEHIAEVARLFDLYRQFYECEADLTLARRFIEARLAAGESTIFVAEVGSPETLAGFVQLYPSFCSVEAIKIMILYDLYVDDTLRSQGIGARLMNRAALYAKEQGAARVDLLTAHSNLVGQRLYESLGYEKTNEDFYAYSLYQAAYPADSNG
ncbi:MAG: GNAT family N-acetyltransferase [Pseudomonadota bacterium]